MNREQLYYKLKNLVPSCYEEEDGFLDHLQELFVRYRDEILPQYDEYPISVKTKDGKVTDFDKDRLLAAVNEVITYVWTAANLVYEGSHWAAYIRITQLLQKKLTRLPLKTIPEKSIFYRMRTMESRNNVTTNDMFHIPLKMRGIVKTQRYSAPGYPCLYLGESVYGCWEELLRPGLSHCFVSKFETQRDVNLLDLSFPELSRWLEKDEHDRYTFDSNNRFLFSLARLPLVLSCMVKVKNRNDVFKPEYIIPQLMMEVVTHHFQRCKEDGEIPIFLGVLYHTVHQNNDFSYQDDKNSNNLRLINNIAIPVLDPLSSTKYCPELCKLFKISEPTCDEFEQAKMAYNTDAGHYDIDNGKYLYSVSTFGQLEERLEHFKLKTIDPQ